VSSERARQRELNKQEEALTQRALREEHREHRAEKAAQIRGTEQGKKKL
jgi:hypothetical protein